MIFLSLGPYCLVPFGDFFFGSACGKSKKKTVSELLFWLGLGCFCCFCSGWVMLAGFPGCFVLLCFGFFFVMAVGWLVVCLFLQLGSHVVMFLFGWFVRKIFVGASSFFFLISVMSIFGDILVEALSCFIIYKLFLTV